MRRARDPELLDAVDACPREPFSGVAWRIVRENRDPLLGTRVGGRWCWPGTFDVLYTSLEPEGAKAEVFFHLSRQPVFPSKLVSELHRVVARTSKTLRLADLRSLQPLGVDPARYAEVLYEPTQAIGDAAFFLGCDGLLVPSARWACLNLVIFPERVGPQDLRAEKTEVVDWDQFRRTVRQSRR